MKDLDVILPKASAEHLVITASRWEKNLFKW